MDGASWLCPAHYNETFNTNRLLWVIAQGPSAGRPASDGWLVKYDLDAAVHDDMACGREVWSVPEDCSLGVGGYNIVNVP